MFGSVSPGASEFGLCFFLSHKSSLVAFVTTTVFNSARHGMKDCFIPNLEIMVSNPGVALIIYKTVEVNAPAHELGNYFAIICWHNHPRIHRYNGSHIDIGRR
jgi:hypothetical protein